MYNASSAVFIKVGITLTQIFDMVGKFLKIFDMVGEFLTTPFDIRLCAPIFAFFLGKHISRILFFWVNIARVFFWVNIGAPSKTT